MFCHPGFSKNDKSLESYQQKDQQVETKDEEQAKASASTGTDLVDLKIRNVWRLKKDGEFQRMEKLFEDILNQNPDYLGIHTALGWFFYYDLGRKDEGIHHFEYVVQRHREGKYIKDNRQVKWDIAMAYAGMGGILAEERKYELAESFCLVSLDLLPTPVSYSLMGHLAKDFRNDFDFAVAFHKQALDLAPKIESEKIEIAINRLYQRKTEEANNLIHTIDIQTTPYFWEIARFYGKLGDIEKALSFLKKYLETYQSRPLRRNKIQELILQERDFEPIKNHLKFRRFFKQ